MADEIKDVKKEELVSSTDSEKPVEKKILGKQAIEPDGWNSQPAVVTLEGPGDKVPEESKSKEEIGIAKEKDRIAKRREELLAELGDERKEVKELQAKVDEKTEEEPDPESDDGWGRVDNMIETKIASKREAEDFYSNKPEFYSGEDGNKNRNLVERYMKTNFKSPSSSARKMAHNYIFGEVERELLKDETRRETATKMVTAEVATLGSDSGKSSLTIPKEKKGGIIPRKSSVKDWY